jgi:hypothetical protein
MAKSRLKYGVIAGVVATIVVIAILVKPPARPLNVTVTTGGFTNIPGFGQALSICFSNGGKDSVYTTMLSPGYEFKSRIVDRTKQIDANSLWNVNLSHPKFLEAGKSATTYVALPKESPEPWRIVFGFVRVDWRLRMGSLPPWVNDLSNRILPRKWRMVVPQLKVATDWRMNPETNNVSLGK